MLEEVDTVWHKTRYVQKEKLFPTGNYVMIISYGQNFALNLLESLIMPTRLKKDVPFRDFDGTALLWVYVRGSGFYFLSAWKNVGLPSGAAWGSTPR